MGNIADVVAIGNGKIATNYLSLTEAQKIKRSIVGARENYDEYGPGILKDIIKDPTVQYILIEKAIHHPYINLSNRQCRCKYWNGT